MTPRDEVQLLVDMAVLRLSGEVPLPDAARRVTEAILYAREQQIGKLLVNTLELKPMGRATLAASYFRIQEWARASDGFVRLALVIRPDLTDPQGFGLTVAANSGLMAGVFATEDAALAWLRRGA